MSRLIALDHRTARAEPNRESLRTDDTGEWSLRRRLASLVVCIVGSWSLLLVPVLLWF